MTRRSGWQGMGLLLIGLLLSTALGIGWQPAAAATTTELFFSEYVEGSSNNKALEIYNGTGTTIDLASTSYVVQMYFNGNTSAGLTINLDGSVADGDVFVLAHSSADATILAQADQTNGSGWFNGDDAIVLRKGGTSGSIVDVIGQIGVDPGTEWGVDATSTADNTLRRNANIATGDTDASDAFDPSIEWTGFAVNTFDGLGAHSVDDEPTPTMTPTPEVTPSPTPEVGALRIRDIQGASHISPLKGQQVSNVPGIVTATRGNGFYIQDASADDDEATSEAIFIFTSSAPSVSVGDAVLVSGTVSEFRPGGSSSTNLSITQIGSATITVTSSANPSPAAIVIGEGGRVPPTTIIEDDSTGDVETTNTFDPASDGIDFYESLESMLVQVNDAVAVSPRRDFSSNTSEVVVLGDNGANASVRTTRGGIVIRPDDFNPERIILSTPTDATPTINVGDRFNNPVLGVIDYSFGNFKLRTTSSLETTSAGLSKETTTAAGLNELSIATFNVENLDPGDDTTKFSTLASLIVTNLRAPDIIAVEEIQDNNGPTNDAVVDATETYNRLIEAITAAGGPTYQFRQIDPVDDQDGGQPGGNIRVGFLFRPDRGLTFVDRAGGGTTVSTTVVSTETGPQLSASPGRIDPTNAAFAASRKPLAGEFSFNGQTLFVIANHFNSKGGDQPLFGRFQPPTRSSEEQRKQQAQLVNNFVDEILAADANAKVVVLGDINDFEFSEAMQILAGDVLTPLITTLPQAERYSYVFEGNSQALDHILVSKALRDALVEYDIVHVNAEFSDQVSDHDPQVARFKLTPATNFPVRPVLECVAAREDGTYSAFFGYKNENAFAYTIPIGNKNRFVPGPSNRGQPTVFQPGRVQAAFEVAFDGNALVWVLNGRTATASRNSARCTP